MERMIVYFFVSMGIVIGGSILGGVGYLLTRQAPMYEIELLAPKLKIWGLVGALGGTFDSFMQIERVLEGAFSPIVKQIIYILSAFAGAHVGTKLILWLVQGEQ
ncbi:MAG: YtrH family sporulation protein [Bacillaceae bacterium]|nr:YtrH family sporulation protein [Bacillaceae bacterium]